MNERISEINMVLKIVKYFLEFYAENMAETNIA